MRTIILKLEDDYIYFNNSTSIGWEYTDFPKRHCRLDGTRLIYVEAEQLHYNKDTRTLKIRIVNYTSTDIKHFEEQKPKYPIEWLEIDKMDWLKFKPLLRSYNADLIRYYFYNADELFTGKDSMEETKFRLRTDIQSLRQGRPNQYFQQEREAVVENIQTVVKVKFEDATFYNGKIGFKIKLKEYHITKDFFIENQFLKEEFEYIKAWIIKKIGKWFLASIKIKLVDGKIEEASAGSDEIDQINTDLIESIRILKVTEFLKKPAKEKLLYSHDDVLSVVNERDGEVNILSASASDILEIMIKQGVVRNVRQLGFLSRDKQSLNDKLRFTAKPHFGFVFKVEGIAKQFYIWELLNTHATYVWEKDIEELASNEFIENEISLIKANGREEYRRYYKNLISKDFQFHLIEHEGADLSEEERFVKWKDKVEAIIAKN
jgi:hypothetical protein